MWLLIVLMVLLLIVLIYWQVREYKLLKTVTQKSRGTWSERDLILKILKKGIPAENIFHDLYIKKRDGSFSQIDIVVATEVGIIVVEVKEYSGWIFGVGHNSHWIQLLNYGKNKYSFYNPIFQNDGHIRCLRSQLTQFADVPFYSLIVFYGSCVLKKVSFIPNGISIVKSDYALEAMSNILQNNTLVNYSNMYEISELLKEAVENGGDRTNQIQHVENIKNMLR